MDNFLGLQAQLKLSYVRRYRIGSLYGTWCYYSPFQEYGIIPVEPSFHCFHDDNIGDHKACKDGKE